MNKIIIFFTKNRKEKNAKMKLMSPLYLRGSRW